MSLESVSANDEWVRSSVPGVDIDFSDVRKEIEDASLAGIGEATKPPQADARYQKNSSELDKTKGKPQLSPAPDTYVREINAYKVSREYVACRASLYAIEHAQNHPVADVARQTKILVALYARYTASCFGESDPSVVRRLALFHTTWPPQTGGLGFFCLGFDVDGRHIVTAKHCVADLNAIHELKNSKDPRARQKKVAASKILESKIVFADAPDVRHEYDLSSLHAGEMDKFFSPFNPEDDIAIVELRHPRAQTKFRIDAPHDWDRILVTTVFLDDTWLRSCASNRAIPSCATSQLIKQDTAATCVIATVKNQCLSHACQSRPGASGGPIIAKRGDDLVLVGVHTGAIDDVANAPCALPRGNFFPNYGVSISSSPAIAKLLQTGRAAR